MESKATLTIEQITAQILYMLVRLRLAEEAAEISAFTQYLTKEELGGLEDRLRDNLTEICPNVIQIWEEAEAQAGAIIVEIMLILENDPLADPPAIGYFLKGLMKSYLETIISFSEILDEGSRQMARTLWLKLGGRLPSLSDQVNRRILQVAVVMNRLNAASSLN